MKQFGGSSSDAKDDDDVKVRVAVVVFSYFWALKNALLKNNTYHRNNSVTPVFEFVGAELIYIFTNNLLFMKPNFLSKNFFFIPEQLLSGEHQDLFKKSEIFTFILLATQ